MRSLLLLVGFLAGARASLIDLNNINTPTDALAYVLNLKCIRERLFLTRRLHHYHCMHCTAVLCPCAGLAFLSACSSE